MTWLLAWQIAKRFWWVAALALVVVAGWVLLDRYGDRRASQAEAPWQAAASERRIRDAADEAINRSANDYIEAEHAKQLAAIARDRDATVELLLDTRARGRRVEEAYRQFQADAAARVSASAAAVERLLGDIEVARIAVDRDRAAADQAARGDAVTLTSLQAEVRPWVVLQ